MFLEYYTFLRRFLIVFIRFYHNEFLNNTTTTNSENFH